MINSDPDPTRRADAQEDEAVNAILRSGRARRDRARGPRDGDRRRDLVRLLSARLRAARDRAMSEPPPPHSDRMTRASSARRVSSVAGRRCRSPSSCCWSCMAAFAGIHQATMPQSRGRDRRPAHAAPRRANSSRAISAARVEPDGSVTVRAIGQQYSFTPQCILVPTGHAGHVPRDQRRRGAWLPDRRARTSTSCWCRATSPLLPRVSRQPGERHMPCHEFCGIGP